MDFSPEKPLNNTEEISFTRKEIFIFVKSVLNENINVVTDIVEMEVSKKLKHPYVLPKRLKDAMGRLVSEFKKRWQQVSRNGIKFFRKFDEWLNVPVSFIIENEGFREIILEQGNDNDTLVKEYLPETEEFLINENLMIKDLSDLPVVNKRSISQASQSDNHIQIPKNPHTEAKRCRKNSEDEKVRRMAGLCQQDKVIFEIKWQHELKVEQMTQRHLDIVHNMQQEHLREMHKRELRKAEAEAQLAELRLARESSLLWGKKII